jgi:hypothetical protein
MQTDKLSEKIERIIIGLGDNREDTLALMEDLWAEIDHTNADSIREGSERMIALVTAATGFRTVCEDLGNKLRSFLPSEPTPASPPPNSDWFAGQQRIKPTEPWAYRRPSGFVLHNKQFPKLNTWRGLYESLLIVLRDHDPKLFQTLPDHASLVSRHNKPYFSRDPGKLREALKLADNLYAEFDLNPNRIGKTVGRVLRVMGIADTNIAFYVRSGNGA